MISCQTESHVIAERFSEGFAKGRLEVNVVEERAAGRNLLKQSDEMGLSVEVVSLKHKRSS